MTQAILVLLLFVLVMSGCSRGHVSGRTTPTVGSPGYPSYVQSHWNAVGSRSGGLANTLSNTLPNTRAGDLFLVWIDWDCGPEDHIDVQCTPPRTFQAIYDDINNQYIELDTEHGYFGAEAGSDTTRLYYAINKSAGKRTITFNVSAGQNAGTFDGSFVAEYQPATSGGSIGIDGVTWTIVLDSQNVSNPSAFIITSKIDDVIISLCSGSGLNSPTSVGNGFTLRYTGNGWLFPFGLADKQVASPQAVSVPWVSPQAQGWGLWTVAIH